MILLKVLMVLQFMVLVLAIYGAASSVVSSERCAKGSLSVFDKVTVGFVVSVMCALCVAVFTI